MDEPGRTARHSGETAGANEAAHALLKASGLSQQIGFVLRLAQAAVWADLVEAFRPFGLRPVHYSILLILSAAPGSRQQEIGDALSVQRPNLVSLVDELEKQGTLRRAAHPNDRRSHALYLTDAGAALLERMKHVHTGHERRLNALLSRQDRQRLIEGLTRLKAVEGKTPA